MTGPTIETESPPTPYPYHTHQCRDGVMKYSQESFEQLEPAANGLYMTDDRFLEHRLCGTCGTTLCKEHLEHDPEKVIHQACGAPTYLCQCVEVPVPESSLTRLLKEGTALEMLGELVKHTEMPPGWCPTCGHPNGHCSHTR